MENFDLEEGSGECEDIFGLCLVSKIMAPKILNKQARINIIHSVWKIRASLIISSWSDNVQVHGLPVDKLTRAHRETISKRLRKLVPVEAYSEGLLLTRNFLRIRVEVDVTKPLLQGFTLYRRGVLG
ncbi:hypothetical protein ACSBR1_024036 [Camellia fascicularis]